MTWPSPLSVHWCSFRRVSGSTRNEPALTSWTDKCRCGRIIQVEMRNVAGKITTTKTWFDKEGRLERVTGGDERHEPHPTSRNDSEHEKPPATGLSGTGGAEPT